MHPNAPYLSIYSGYFNIYSVYVQALKYILQGHLTKCPMTLSLGRTYVRWPSVQFWLRISLNDMSNEYQHNVLILNGKCYEDIK
jgi:hypothetical protein